MASCSCAACMAFIAASLRPDQPFDGTGRLGDHLVATCAVPAGDRLPDAVADVLVEQADRDGLQRLVDEDAYCIDVLTQVAAATKALQTVAVGLLDEHVRHCVREAVTSGDGARSDEMITEATRAIERLIRS